MTRNNLMVLGVAIATFLVFGCDREEIKRTASDSKSDKKTTLAATASEWDATIYDPMMDYTPPEETDCYSDEFNLQDCATPIEVPTGIVEEPQQNEATTETGYELPVDVEPIDRDTVDGSCKDKPAYLVCTNGKLKEKIGEKTPICADRGCSTPADLNKTCTKEGILQVKACQ